MTAASTTQLRRLRRATIGTPANGFNTTVALVVFIIVILVAAPMAQQAPPAFTPAGGSWTAASAPLPDVPTDIDLLVGRSTVVNVGSPIARVSLTVPDIADAMVTAPSQLLIHGKQPGTISLFVWDRGGSIKTFEVKVRRDLTILAAQLKQLFPGEPIVGRRQRQGRRPVRHRLGRVRHREGGQRRRRLRREEGERRQPAEAAGGRRLQPGDAPRPVRRSEPQRGAGARRQLLPQQGQLGRPHGPSGRARAGLRPGKGRLVFSDFLNLFVFSGKAGLGAVVRALQNKGLFQSLAEPNLVAIDGKEASFLAGGEFPIPIVQSGRARNSVTIMFKEFGVRLAFTPTVLGGDLVRIKVKPEVSSLDFANAIVLDGFRDPGPLDAPHGNGSGAARRADVRDRGSLEQHADRTRCPRFRASATSRFSASCFRARRTRRT